MKTVLAVVGVLALLVVLGIVGGGIYIAKKGPELLAQSERQDIASYVADPNHPAAVTAPLRRIANALALDASFARLAVAAIVIRVTHEASVTARDIDMVQEAAELLERGGTTLDDSQAFQKKYGGTAPGRKR